MTTEKKWVPMAGWYLVQLVEPEEVTAGGIVIPRTAVAMDGSAKADKVNRGKVLAVGGPKMRVDAKGTEWKHYPEAAEGDVLLFSRWSGVFDGDGSKVWFVKFEDAIGIEVGELGHVDVSKQLAERDMLVEYFIHERPYVLENDRRPVLEVALDVVRNYYQSGPTACEKAILDIASVMDVAWEDPDDVVEAVRGLMA